MEENYQLNIPKSVGTDLSKREKVSTLMFVAAFYVGTKNFCTVQGNFVAKTLLRGNTYIGWYEPQDLWGGQVCGRYIEVSRTTREL